MQIIYWWSIKCNLVIRTYFKKNQMPQGKQSSRARELQSNQKLIGEPTSLKSRPQKKTKSLKESIGVERQDLNPWGLQLGSLRIWKGTCNNLTWEA